MNQILTKTTVLIGHLYFKSRSDWPNACASLRAFVIWILKCTRTLFRVTSPWIYFKVEFIHSHLIFSAGMNTNGKWPSCFLTSPKDRFPLQKKAFLSRKSTFPFLCNAIVLNRAREGSSSLRKLSLSIRRSKQKVRRLRQRRMWVLWMNYGCLTEQFIRRRNWVVRTKSR